MRVTRSDSSDGQHHYLPVTCVASVENDQVVLGIPGDEATIKTFTRQGSQIVLLPANERLAPMAFDAGEVEIYGRVVTVMRRL